MADTIRALTPDAAEDLSSEARRLERLWSGEFGDDYVERNLGAYESRERFWSTLLDRYPCSSACEIGANVGGNLQWIARRAGRVTGLDLNRKALRLLGQRLPGVAAVEGSARALPFADRSFDLVFTMGVLIHQPDESLTVVIDEMIRVADGYLLCGEYFDSDTVEVPYRGVDGALFRRDYGGLFLQRGADLTLVEQGFLGRDDGWDDVTWWLFRRAPSTARPAVSGG